FLHLYAAASCPHALLELDQLCRVDTHGLAWRAQLRRRLSRRAVLARVVEHRDLHAVEHSTEHGYRTWPGAAAESEAARTGRVPHRLLRTGGDVDGRGGGDLDPAVRSAVWRDLHRARDDRPERD